MALQDVRRRRSAFQQLHIVKGNSKRTMNEFEGRWALPDLQSAIKWCARRNEQNIRCIIDVLGEYAREDRQSADSVDAYLAAAKAIAEYGLDASLTVKLSALGVLFDQTGCRKNVYRIVQEAARLGVGFEIDMEGQGLVTFAIDVAAACAEKGHRVSLALQAYLDRTRDDLERASASGITARIVKGAYVGSTTDFAEIQQRFKELVSVLTRTTDFFYRRDTRSRTPRVDEGANGGETELDRVRLPQRSR